MFIWVIYYVVLIELLKNMWSKEQNSRTSNYVDIMGMFINSGLAGNVYSSGIFVTFFFLIIRSCFLITDKAIILAVSCSSVS